MIYLQNHQEKFSRTISFPLKEIKYKIIIDFIF